MSTPTVTDNNRPALIFAVSQGLAYLHLGRDFTEIDCRDGEGRVTVEPFPIEQSKHSFVAAVGLVSGLAWCQERHGPNWVSDMVRGWREDAEYAAEEGLEDAQNGGLVSTYDDIDEAAPAGLAFFQANQELIDEAANFVAAAGRRVSGSAFASVFQDRVVGASVENLAAAAEEFGPYKLDLHEIGSIIAGLHDEAERAG